MVFLFLFIYYLPTINMVLKAMVKDNLPKLGSRQPFRKTNT